MCDRSFCYGFDEALDLVQAPAVTVVPIRDIEPVSAVFVLICRNID
jgi:hypothetical protein